MTNYAGKVFTMESFTGQNTDANGELIINLANTPVDDNAVMLSIGNQTKSVEFKSRTGAAVTVVVRKLRYDRTDDGASGSVTNQPGGVTVTTSSSFGTSSTGSSNDPDNSGGSNNAPGGHNHSVTTMFNHDHTNTETDLPLAANEVGTINVTVGYAF